MFGGEDDDADFTLASGQGTLKHLFGGSDGDSQSLKFSAPKQPSEAKAKDTGGVRFAVAAQTYHYLNNVYTPKGKLGVAVTNANSIMIYGAKQRVLSHCQITTTTALSVTERNFVSFYDDAQHCWGIMFDSETEISKFLSLATICKLSHTSVKQELSKVSSTDKIATIGSNITVSYTGWLVEGGGIGAKFDSNSSFTFTLGAGKVIPGWDQTLVGCHEGRDYFLVIPAAEGYGKAGRGALIPPDSTLSFQITITNIRIEEPPPSPITAPAPNTTDINNINTANDALTDPDTSSLESVPITHAPRNEIISRMARMGAQPAFAPMSSPDDPRSRSSSTRSNRRKQSRASQSSVEAKPVVPVKPGPLVPHGMVNGNYGNYAPQYTQPETPDVNMYSIQSLDRNIKNLESKIDALHQNSMLFSNSSIPSLDTQVLMYNIQRLVSENDSLKSEVKEKNKQIETQSGKVTELLDKHQQLICQKNEALEQLQDSIVASSQHTAQQVVNLEQERDELTREVKLLRTQTDNKRFEDESRTNHISSLKTQIEQLYSENMKLQQAVFTTRSELATVRMASSVGGQEAILQCELGKIKERLDTCLLEKLEVVEQLDNERHGNKEVVEQYKRQISRLEREVEREVEKSGEGSIAKRFEESKKELTAELNEAREVIKQREGECLQLRESGSESEIMIKDLKAEVEKLAGELANKDPVQHNISSSSSSELEKTNSELEKTNSELEKSNSELKKSNSDVHDKMSRLRAALQATREELSEERESVNERVKKIINKVFLTLRGEVEVEQEYTGREVLTLAMRVIKHVTLTMLTAESSDEDEPTTALHASHVTTESQSQHSISDDEEAVPDSSVRSGLQDTMSGTQDTGNNDVHSSPALTTSNNSQSLPLHSSSPAPLSESAGSSDTSRVSGNDGPANPLEEGLLEHQVEEDSVAVPAVVPAQEAPAVPPAVPAPVHQEPAPPEVESPRVVLAPLEVDPVVEPVVVPVPVVEAVVEPVVEAEIDRQEFFPDLDEEDLWVQAPAEAPPPPSLSFEPNVNLHSDVVLGIEDNTVEEVFGARAELVLVEEHRERPPPLFSDSEDDDLGFLS